MPKKQTRYKYKCQELMCNAVIRHDKWSDHCRKKHVYKFKNNIKIKYKVIEVKDNNCSVWKLYTETKSDSRNSCDEDNNDEEITLTDESKPSGSTLPERPDPEPGFESAPDSHEYSRTSFLGDSTTGPKAETAHPKSHGSPTNLSTGSPTAATPSISHGIPISLPTDSGTALRAAPAWLMSSGSPNSLSSDYPTAATSSTSHGSSISLSTNPATVLFAQTTHPESHGSPNNLSTGSPTAATSSTSHGSTISLSTNPASVLFAVPSTSNECFKTHSVSLSENSVCKDSLEVDVNHNVPIEVSDIGDPHDPSTYSNKRLTTKNIELALKLEDIDIDPNYDFPVTNKRKFQTKWRTHQLKDGTIKKRKWLVYSKKNDSSYCLHCLLFALPNQQSIWSSENGYQPWKDGHSLRAIECHETSKSHRSCQIERLAWTAGKGVSQYLLQKQNSNIDHQREVLSVVIDCCRYLIDEMLAFRKNTVVEGKLPKLFMLLAKYNPDARVYLDKIEKARKAKKKLMSNFLSYRSISSLVSLMALMVTKKIVSEINECQKYSIIFDSTQDVTKKEASTVLIRYVQTREPVKPVERLVKVFTSGDTSGANLKLKLMETLKDVELNHENIVGQSMDGAGNMRGTFCGLKTPIEKECSTAFYVWCTSHRFALVIEKSIEICPQIRELFNILEELYRLFNSGHKRHDIFVEKMSHKEKHGDKRKRLKRVQTTRWTNKAEATKVVITCYNEIISSLDELQNVTKFDKETVTLSSGIKKKIHTFDVAVALQVAIRVFNVMNPVTVTLQGVMTDYGAVRGIIQNVKAKLTCLRSDSAWEEIYEAAVNFSNKHDVPEPTLGRIRRKKRFMDEVGVDEPILNSKHRLKVEVHLKVLDSLLLQLEDRFPDHNLKMVQQMSVFSHLGIMKISHTHINPSDIKELCTYYEWDEDEVSNEVNCFSEIYAVAHKSVDVSDIIGETAVSYPIQEDVEDDDHQEEDQVDPKTSQEKLKNSWLEQGFLKPYRCIINFSGFHRLEVVYSTLLSLAVTSCSAERAMSRIKLVKTRLRSSLSDEWLSNLMVLSAERDIFANISNEEIIDNFSKSTALRKKLLEKK